MHFFHYEIQNSSNKFSPSSGWQFHKSSLFNL